MNALQDTRIDRLYALLPAIHQIRDSEQGLTLKALLRIISEQINLLEDDITRLYENSFIETADDWAVYYIGDLIAYQSLNIPGEYEQNSVRRSKILSRVLTPRSDVANTIGNRRRKGTHAVLEKIAAEVAGWPAVAVESYRKIACTQHLNHLKTDRSRSVDLRTAMSAEPLDSPFNRVARSPEARRINSRYTAGVYSLSGIGLYIWRLQAYAVTGAQAAHLSGSRYSFNALGFDSPLFRDPDAETVLPEACNTDEFGLAELRMPGPLQIRNFSELPEALTEAYYSPHFKIWAADWRGQKETQLVPFTQIRIADLSKWGENNAWHESFVLVDPEKGRILFPHRHPPKGEVKVSYFYGFSAPIGGGEYARALREPYLSADSSALVRHFPVGANSSFKSIAAALQAIANWQPNPNGEDKTGVILKSAVLELQDSRVFSENLSIDVPDNTYLQIRAVSGCRPVIKTLAESQAAHPGHLPVNLGNGSRFVLDGLLLSGKGLVLNGVQDYTQAGAQVCIRHCTLVGVADEHAVRHQHVQPVPLLKINHLKGHVKIAESITGALQIHEHAAMDDPLGLSICDCIIDAAISAGHAAIHAPQSDSYAYVNLHIKRSTVFGTIMAHSLELAENCLFNDEVQVARRQIGCIRYCYVAPSVARRTPPRYRCLPDILNPGETLTPVFTSRRYADPGYAQLDAACDARLRSCADDESEPGVFHDLFQPQRETNLRTRLTEYVPCEYDINLIFTT